METFVVAVVAVDVDVDVDVAVLMLPCKTDYEISINSQHDAVSSCCKLSIYCWH